MINSLKKNFMHLAHKYAVQTSWRTEIMSIRKAAHLMMYREIITASCENHTKHSVSSTCTTH
jgi:hypothetical protein